MSIAHRVLAALAVLGVQTVGAQALYTETFEGAAASNAAYPVGVIAGSGVEVVNGYVWIGADTTHGNILDLGSGWYTPNVDPATNVGSSTARSTATFNLQAGYTYTLTFDYSRQAWSAGNGPFDTALTVSMGSGSVTYSEVTGFYYGADWKAGSLSFTPLTNESGVHVVFTASAPPGYSGMTIDNVSLIGLAPVPEPVSGALLLAGLAVVGLTARRRLAAQRR